MSDKPRLPPELKSIIIGAVVRPIGAALLDLGVTTTGWALIALGALAIIFGPQAVNL